MYHAPITQGADRGSASDQEIGSDQGSGLFSVLIYNIAGLSDWISKSTPSVNTPIISELINRYDLVLVQEDFEYHDALDKDARHTFRSSTQTDNAIFGSDGLNRYSDTEFDAYERIQWQECYGYVRYSNDCLAVKGFTVASHQVNPDLRLDVYNLHADAGRSEGDKKARRSEFEQLASYISQHSKNKAIIVAGDTNLKISDSEDEEIIRGFLEQTGLQIVARVLPGVPERIDKVMFRSSATLQLIPVTRQIAEEFVDDQGIPLSDHLALAVSFQWRVVAASGH